ncbi:MAG: hypothetical protein M1818_007154 [Claussenomyces sp. TS43310]|nr:MAG: hypothetical protein M1818_007154 [Claussenomyces sp. TS43310]
MPREVEPSLNEKQFVLHALQENTRTDGRAFDQFRELDLTFGDEYGVADVRLGNTRVLVKVSAEVTKPFPDRPFDGIFTITTELSPMASPSFEPGRPSEAEILLSRLLEKTLRRSSALDTESLCLVAAQKVWSVRADVHILSYDGNLIDTSCLAIVAALQHFRKCDTSIEGETVTIYTPAEREPVPLSLLHLPFCVTFSFYNGQDELVLVDTTLLEEQLRDASVTISMNRHGEICQIAKLGGAPIDAVVLLQCTSLAAVKTKDLNRLVGKKLEEDKKGRDKGGLIAELSAENAR